MNPILNFFGRWWRLRRIIFRHPPDLLHASHLRIPVRPRRTSKAYKAPSVRCVGRGGMSGRWECWNCRYGCHEQRGKETNVASYHSRERHNNNQPRQNRTINRCSYTGRHGVLARFGPFRRLTEDRRLSKSSPQRTAQSVIECPRKALRAGEPPYAAVDRDGSRGVAVWLL